MPYTTPIEVGHRDAVGGMWDEMGEKQLQMLIEYGLMPHHDFLDVGCGSLRAGVHLIPYLEPGRYVGIDQEQSLLDAGIAKELGAERAQTFRPQLACMDDFGFERLGRTFDYAIAQSVFSHLEFNLIARCIVNIDRVLNPGGTFFATFFHNPYGAAMIDPIPRQNGAFFTHYDRDPFHYDLAWFEALVAKLSIEMEFIGAWGHPRDQQLLRFTRPA